MNRPSASGCFLFRLLNDRLGPKAYRNMEIIDDNARGHIQLGDKGMVSNEKLDKAQLHIASRWGDSPRHGILKDAQLRPISRRSEYESSKDTRVKNACGNDRQSISETRTVRRIDRPQEKDSVSKAGSKGIDASSLWRNTTLPLSELPFSENDLHAYHGLEIECKNSRVVQFTARAVMISSSSPQLPIRT
jgi:hypothetical protein